MPTFLRGEHSDLPVWIERAELEIKQQQILAELVIETGESAPNRTVGGRPAGDERTMRGIPILGSGFGGAIMGTRPDTAVERKLDGLLRRAAA